MTILRTHSGRDLDLNYPDPVTIDIRDIAVQLSRINRFNGATALPYNVAQHSVLVARIAARLGASPHEQVIALLHDAHEAYIGDMTRPVNAMLSDQARQEWTALRDRLDRAIFSSFNIGFERLPVVVELADNLALATEWRDLMSGPPPSNLMAMPWPVKPRRHDLAEQDFLDSFYRLEIAAGLGLGLATVETPSGQIVR